MDLSFGPEDEAFREEIRGWLAENLPAGPRPWDDLTAARAYDCAWQRKLYDAGHAGLSWPKDYGGAGRSPVQELIFFEELAGADGPDHGSLLTALGHAGPTLIALGTPEQQQRYLPAILRGEAVWCQGFSEPGAGSDLASLRTSGRVEDDVIIVNGQKIWSSYAQVADYQELLIRTDPGSVRHQGLTWLVCDMKTPGIEIRPIRTMDGGAHFAEVFYDEVTIPVSNVVGGLNQGWRTAMTTFGFERGTLYLDSQLRLPRRAARLAAELVASGHGSRYEAARVRAMTSAVRALSYRLISEAARQLPPGPATSMSKVATTDALRAVAELGMAVRGPQTLSLDDEMTHEGLYEYAWLLAGGTPEIHRNVIAERVLGLPR